MQLYNYITRNHYSFDFDKWFSLFDDGTNKMREWKSKLLYAYQKIHFRSEISKCFQYALHLYDTEVFLHLNIDHILGLPYKKEHITKLELSDIGTADSNKKCFFFPVDTYNYKHLISKEPIIFLKVPTDLGIRFAVIDGNHRVTSKKAFHFHTINTLIYFSGHENDFANLFEYTLYSFLIENINFLI